MSKIDWEKYQKLYEANKLTTTEKDVLIRMVIKKT
jgi:hypothetical protein